jgi:hypothetical protein
MRPARERSWRAVAAASSIRSDVESEAIKEIVEAVGGTLTCDANSARFVLVR